MVNKSEAKNHKLERDQIEKVIRDSIGWALTKDFNRLYSIMAQDEDFFIFHPDSKSTIRGSEAFKALSEHWRNDAFQATDFTVKELQITLSESGMVAWYSAYLDDHAEWNGKPMGWDDARWTGVLEKRGGNWVIVQMHFSFPKDG